MQPAATCRPAEHLLSRRSLLCRLLGGAAVFLGRSAPAAADVAKAKRLLVINHSGGLSQLESWDPKPATIYGGPCRAIATSVPGIHVCEWLPFTARQMHRLLVVRSMSTNDDDHHTGHYQMFTGRRESAGLVYPSVECVAHKFLAPPQRQVPGFVSIGDAVDSAFLGPRYSPVKIEAGQPPSHLQRPSFLTIDSNERRTQLRHCFDERFARTRSSAETVAYTYSFEQAAQLMRNRDLFALNKESPRDHDRYGRHEFGQRALQARRLLDKGVTVVYCGHDGYDSHAENFNTHLNLLGQFDRPFACLLEDLEDRGLLEETLVVAMGEFGRTPNINFRMGRDHWSRCWSLVLGGASVPRGGVYGKTNPTGTEVIEKKVTAAQFFHTLCLAMGIDATANYQVEGQAVPIGDPAAHPRPDMLA